MCQRFKGCSAHFFRSFVEQCKGDGFYSVYVQACAGYSTKSRIICTTMGHGTMFSVSGFQTCDNLLVNKMVSGIATESFGVMLGFPACIPWRRSSYM